MLKNKKLYIFIILLIIILPFLIGLETITFYPETGITGLCYYYRVGPNHELINENEILRGCGFNIGAGE
jgi:hypothetical protein